MLTNTPFDTGYNINQLISVSYAADTTDIIPPFNITARFKNGQVCSFQVYGDAPITSIHALHLIIKAPELVSHDPLVKLLNQELPPAIVTE